MYKMMGTRTGRSICSMRKKDITSAREKVIGRELWSRLCVHMCRLVWGWFFYLSSHVRLQEAGPTGPLITSLTSPFLSFSLLVLSLVARVCINVTSWVWYERIYFLKLYLEILYYIYVRCTQTHSMTCVKAWRVDSLLSPCGIPVTEVRSLGLMAGAFTH